MVFFWMEYKVECGLNARLLRVGTCLVLSIIDSGATCLGLQNPAIDSCRAAGCFTVWLLLELHLCVSAHVR